MGSDESNLPQLHFFFFPFMAHGHMIPTIDMAKLFASRGVKSTILTTPVYANLISKTIEISKQFGLEIHTLTIPFPFKEVGLPEGSDNLDRITPDQIINFMTAVRLLQHPLEQVLQDHNPDCLIADMFFPWATDAAKKFNIPRIVFHGTSLFSLCCAETIRLHQPHQKISSETEEFVIPNIPGEIKLTRSQIPDFVKNGGESGIGKLLTEARESELKSYGVVVNSFNELESPYAEHYRKVLGRKAWHIGPVSLCNKANEDKVLRGKEASIDEHECLKWLDSKNPNSVVYVCFGSSSRFGASQLREIAMGLEACGQEFIWVVKKSKEEEDNNEEKWLPDGFEKRIEGKGMIIQGWAPQVLILDHKAVGGFVTHCGWNSIVEGVAAGLPMVTWPVFAEQFYNEKLLTQVLKIGVGVGVLQWGRQTTETVKSEAVATAVSRIMEGEEAEEMRSRAKSFGVLARKAVEEGGSSYCDLNALIEEMRLHDKTSKNTT